MGISSDFRDKLLKEDLYDTNAAKYAKKMKSCSNIIIWGCGSAGQQVYDFSREYDCSHNIRYFADNSSIKWGTKNNGLPVLSPKEVVKQVQEKPDTYIIIASLYLVSIRKQLISLGILDRNLDSYGYGLAKEYFTFKKESAYRLIYTHYPEFERVYNDLADEHSKEVYLGLLNYKISLDNRYIEGIASPSKDQYFDEEVVKLDRNEVFCDCGSYNGDTLETFAAITQGRYRKYIAIEASKEIYDELNEKVTENDYQNVHTYNFACWNDKAVLKFQSAQTASHITDTGGVTVLAEALDKVLGDEKVTYLKMDIEGAEEKALLGARNLILQNKPILGICIYHSLEDYYKLPILMKSLNQEYQLFIRNYTDMADAETVCYAIPKERLVKNQ